MKYLWSIVTLLGAITVTISQEDKPLKAIAHLSANGVVIGNVTFTQNKDGEAVQIDYDLIGLSPGKHDFHIHEKGDFNNDCLPALQDYAAVRHDHSKMRYVWDLGFAEADINGKAKTSFTNNVLTLSGSNSIIGHVNVIHEFFDDSNPGPDFKKTGNPGRRVACGIIESL